MPVAAPGEVRGLVADEVWREDGGDGSGEVSFFCGSGHVGCFCCVEFGEDLGGGWERVGVGRSHVGEVGLGVIGMGLWLGRASCERCCNLCLCLWTSDDMIASDGRSVR